jgi:glycosyltransferase involved in cell wall biosynthesis
MNLVYNASDCLVSTSTGEGWGLSTTDAMCAGLPVIVPGNTANLDIVGKYEDRGWLIKTGGDIDHQIVLYGMTCNPRDIVHADSMIEKLEYVWEGRGGALENLMTMSARQWCLNYTPEKIKAEWKKLFAFLEAQKEVMV